jgi:ectoine hydroxylase-related dioxygenase (phytanoyl-CoA dioxygenase family)
LAHRESKLGYVCREHDGADALAVPVRAGNIVVFSSLMPHRTGPNVTSGVRKSYILQYAPDGARVVQTGALCDAPDRQYLILKNDEPVSPPQID